MAEALYERTFPIFSRNFDKAGENSAEIKTVLKSLEFDPELIRRVVVLAFEAEMNVVIHADRGELKFCITEEDIQVNVVDEGPGIPDVELAMEEGYSTATDDMREMGFGFGMGLPNIKRNADFLEVTSQVGKGTTLIAKVLL